MYFECGVCYEVEHVAVFCVFFDDVDGGEVCVDGLSAFIFGGDSVFPC